MQRSNHREDLPTVPPEQDLPAAAQPVRVVAGKITQSRLVQLQEATTIVPSSLRKFLAATHDEDLGGKGDFAVGRVGPEGFDDLTFEFRNLLFRKSSDLCAKLF
jgi:hypothetical protein